MQKVKLKREIISNKAILGRLELEGNEIAKTLENPWLNNEPFISCIPTGKYIVRKYSSAKYPDVWELQDVDGRSYILIHSGNIPEHTQGCILIGRKWGFLGEDIAVLDSRNTLEKLREILDDNFEIEIVEL